MSDEKGKGRALSNRDGISSKGSRVEEPSLSSSILTRVAASATGLTRSAFAAPNSNETNDRADAAAALSNAGKRQPSSRGDCESAAWAESSKSSQYPKYEAGGSAGFRFGHDDERVRQSENEFSDFLDGIDSFIPSESISRQQAAGDSFGDTWTRVQNGQAQSTTSISTTVAEQENRDGEGVLVILTDPKAGDEHFEAAHEDDTNDDWGLSAEQLSQLQAMTKELFPRPEPHGSISTDNPFNLVPGFEGASDTELTGQPGHIALNQWKDQWEGVLTRYTDEVWGGLLPLVKDARQEFEDIKERTSELRETKALSRLEAILGHLQKR